LTTHLTPCTWASAGLYSSTLVTYFVSPKQHIYSNSYHLHEIYSILCIQLFCYKSTTKHMTFLCPVGQYVTHCVHTDATVTTVCAYRRCFHIPHHPCTQMRLPSPYVHYSTSMCAQRRFFHYRMYVQTIAAFTITCADRCCFQHLIILFNCILNLATHIVVHIFQPYTMLFATR
jgi:hypothetical protein